jgi:hypothetical protein
MVHSDEMAADRYGQRNTKAIITKINPGFLPKSARPPVYLLNFVVSVKKYGIINQTILAFKAKTGSL